jgi:hypothetical protein
METIGLHSAGNVLFGTSLLADRPFSLQTLPEAMPTVAGPMDSYVKPNASVAADHASLKTPGTATYAAVTQKIEQIADDPALTDKQKRAAINDLRKQLGLSKGDMKKFYTKPLEQAYAQKIEQLKAAGIDTPEKQQLLEQLESKKKLYNSMYKAGGCVKKVFKGIGKGLATVATVAAGVATAIVNPASLIPMAASLISKIPGVSKVTNFVRNGLDKVTGWVDTGLGYFQRGVQFTRDLTTIFGGGGNSDGTE